MNDFLKGIKIVELGTYVAVPKASRMMADWGAEVIKVEPLSGESWRTIGRTYNVPYSKDCNPMFHTPNANKKSIALDLKSPEGMEVLHELLANADIFITNTRGKSLQKIGLDYPSLKEKYPKLIYAYFSGYGSEGPDRDRPGYDVSSYWAKAGIPLEWTTKESIPFRATPGFGDGTVAMAILSGLLAALYGRDKKGCGEYMETSLYACALWYNSCGIVRAQYQSDDAFPISKYDQSAPYNLAYQSGDGVWFIFSAPNWNNVYDKLFEKIGLGAFIDDERFATLEACRANMRLLVDLLEQAYKAMTIRQISDVFLQLDFVSEILVYPGDVIKDEQAWANKYLQNVSLPNGDVFVVPSNPIQFSSDSGVETKPSPKLGEHSMEILQSLGCSGDKIDQLIEHDVIFADS